jgi:pimeloyl-ACP methyl ester carboxylesterase
MAGRRHRVNAATYNEAALPNGIRSRMVDNGNGLSMHVLEAGFDDPARPVLLLLHGFPELAYSWRKVMPALADAGYRVIAPDQRGYGLTIGWSADYDDDLGPFRFLNLVRDVLGLLSAMDIESVAAVVGHDFGAFAAAHCALIRPDVFRAVALMSAPFAGPPPLKAPVNVVDIDADLAALNQPRKHYHRYYSTRDANADMWRCPQGVHDFLRAYFHYKSADWVGNQPFKLEAWSAAELAKLPTYYVMNLGEGMAATAAAEMPTADEIATCAWLPDDELNVYSDTYERNGFQGGLNWYRGRFVEAFIREQQIFSGTTIDVPACFISGSSDWGVYQTPGALEKMQQSACSDFRGCHLIDGAGHWVQQEQPGAVVRLLLAFLAQS